MIRIVFAALATLSLAIAAAQAGQHCQTTCSGYGQARTCNTYCY